METRTIAQLRSIKNPGTTTKYCLPEHENYIAWQYDPLDKTTPDDGKTCIVTTTGKRIKKKMIINIVASNSGTGTPSTSTGATVTPNPPSWIGTSPFNDTLNTATFIPSSGYAIDQHEYRYRITGGSFGSWITATSNVIYLPAADIAVGDLELRVKSATNRNASSTITNSVAFTLIPDAPPTVVSATTTSSTNVQIVFSESVTATVPGYSFKKNGAGLAVLSVSGSDTTWNFTVGAMNSGDTITFSYNSSAGNTLDGAGNELGTFTDRAVSNTLGSSIEVFPNLTNITLSGQAAPGDSTFDPSFFGTAGSSAPVITEYTRTADSGETIILTGHNFTALTSFVCYSKTTTGTATVQSIDTVRQMAIITIPSLGTWSTFLISAQNSSGRSEPILVNKTETWWAEDEIVAGSSASVYGRNLSNTNGTSTSYVYLRNTSSNAVTSATVTAVNPYKVTYTVPAVANGTYEVWVHNGHGGAFGWSKVDGVTVWSGLVWSGTSNPTGLTDNSEAAASANTTAINNAIIAAGSMKTVNIPAGTYYVNDELETSWNTRIKGAGETSTILKTVTSGYHVSNKFFKTSAPENFVIEDLTIEITSNYADNENRYIFPFRNSNRFRTKNVTVKGKGVVLADLHNSTHLYFEDSEFQGKQFDLLTTRQTFYWSCAFKNTNNTLQSIYSWGSREVDVSNCTQSDLGAGADEKGTGRFFTSNGNYGGSKNWYLGDNTGTGLGPAPGTDQNMGEWLMAEGNLTAFSASPTSATASSATFSGTLPTIYTPATDLYFAYIIRGKGAGQWREINPTATNSNTIGVRGNWKVIPDSTSVIQWAPAMTKVVAYNNTVTGRTGLATQEAGVALNMIEPYGNCIDWIADGNTATGYRHLIANFPTMHADNKTDSNLWQYYVNNTAIDCRAGGFIYGKETTYSNPSGPFAFATVIRNLTVTNSDAHDFRYQLPTTAYSHPSILGIVFENVTMDTPVLVYDDDNDFTGASKPANTVSGEIYPVEP